VQLKYFLLKMELLKKIAFLNCSSLGMIVHDTNASLKRMLFSGNAIPKSTLREFYFFFIGIFSLWQETGGI